MLTLINKINQVQETYLEEDFCQSHNEETAVCGVPNVVYYRKQTPLTGLSGDLEKILNFIHGEDGQGVRLLPGLNEHPVMHP